ncbi:MAG: nucleotidyltransferase domain-containing protein, partial [Spirochaetaceae bacterium]|nr:nucleotidyltransferase domain-containing protein [Spirochaetaceae bacterium]
HIQLLINIFKEYNEIERVEIFGSRAMGNQKEASDVDICLYGRNISKGIPSKIKNRIEEETIFPYLVDIVVFDKISSLEFRQHIKTYGMKLRENENPPLKEFS